VQTKFSYKQEKVKMNLQESMISYDVISFENNLGWCNENLRILLVLNL